jgi:hypothetical protein
MQQGYAARFNRQLAGVCARGIEYVSSHHADLLDTVLRHLQVLVLLQGEVSNQAFQSDGFPCVPCTA